MKTELNKTILLNSKNKIKANKLFIDLLISDNIYEYLLESHHNTDMLSRLWGYEKELIQLRLK